MELQRLVHGVGRSSKEEFVFSLLRPYAKKQQQDAESAPPIRELMSTPQDGHLFASLLTATEQKRQIRMSGLASFVVSSPVDSFISVASSVLGFTAARRTALQYSQLTA